MTHEPESELEPPLRAEDRAEDAVGSRFDPLAAPLARATEETATEEIAAGAAAPASRGAPSWPTFPDPTTPAPAPAHSAPREDDAPQPALPRHRRQPWALVVVSALLALTLGLSTYLLVAARALQERSEEWEAAARTTGAELTQTRSDLDGTIGELAATREQLATAQARITELADEKAQLGDEREVQRQLVDYQERISAAAGRVATALTTCIDGQYQLISYLENAAAYDQADLARFRTDVSTVCGAATDANAELQLELER